MGKIMWISVMVAAAGTAAGTAADGSNASTMMGVKHFTVWTGGSIWFVFGVGGGFWCW